MLGDFNGNGQPELNVVNGIDHDISDFLALWGACLNGKEGSPVKVFWPWAQNL